MPEPKIARWRQLADELRGRIRDGTYPVGSTLPHIKDAAVEAGVHHETMRAAYKAVEAEGLIRSMKRRGSVVLAQTPRRRITRGKMITRDQYIGYVFPAGQPGEAWTTHGKPFRSVEPCPETVGDAFGVEPGTEVLRRRRVTSPEGEPPFQLVDSWVSPSAVEDAPAVAEEWPGRGGYLDRLEEAGHGPLSWSEVIRVRMPDREEARYLGVAASLPVFETVITGTSARTGEPVEVTIRVIPGDRVELYGELQRGESAEWPVAPVIPRPEAGTPSG